MAVPAYNAARTLPRLLAALEDQNTPRSFETVIVDDGSTDSTSELLRTWADGHPELRLRVLRQENAGPAAARNRAAREGGGRWILFTDSDCVPRPDWVEILVSRLESDPDAGAVGGSYDIANPQSALARLIHAEILWRHRTMGPYIRFAGSYNLAVRREVFEALGGFSTTYRNASAEDNDFSYRLLKAGWKIRFCPESLVAHHHTEHLGKYLKEQFRHGRWRAVLYRQHPEMAGGDDYTRLKDVVEVPLALGLLAVFPLAVLPSSFRWVMMLGFVALAGSQLCQGLQVSKEGEGASALAFAGVAWLRAFARALGFVRGLLPDL